MASRDELRALRPADGLRYHDYAAGDRRVRFECRTDQSTWEVSEGRTVDAAEIDLLF